MRELLALVALATLTISVERPKLDRPELVRTGLQRLTIDPSETWRVRDLELSKGGAKIYFAEGVLAFATPVDGHRIAAVFSSKAVDAGDAEIIAFPPIPAERASLARFTQSPNLDEHFNEALLFFADDTAQDLLNQIHQHPLHAAPDLAPGISQIYEDTLRSSAAEINVRITQSILDHHRPVNGFLYALMSSRSLGALDFVYQPDQPDPVMFGRIATPAPDQSFFQIWSAFRAKNTQVVPPTYQISDYHVDTTVHPDLSMTSKADFDYLADQDDGAVATLLLTPHLHVTAASIDGNPASIVTHDSPLTTNLHGSSPFLVVNAVEMAPATHHRIHVEYEGSVIRRASDGSYFVDDRNAWYPHTDMMLTMFDLRFHCPENLRLVSTGDPISDDVVSGQRTVHRRTAVAQSLAGFNLGEFSVSTSEGPPYRIEICANPALKPATDLAQQTGQILQYFTTRWMPLSNHNLSVTPIQGFFGQGFPGLIYLSSISYIRERDRPAGLRNASLDSFFSQLLLPHELAHQWWGNIVTPADYRSNWIVESMSNYAALQYLEETQGPATLDAILAGYRADLIKPRAGGELVDSYGPVTFGQRLMTNFGEGVWHDVLYEKGTWIFHMLRCRMGDSAFHQFQLSILKHFAARTISNEDLQQEAALFIPSNQPDRHLSGFFDTWVYDTGIPELSVKGGNLKVGGVPETYSADVPLSCTATRWVRASTGDNALPTAKCGLPSPSTFLFRH